MVGRHEPACPSPAVLTLRFICAAAACSARYVNNIDDVRVSLTQTIMRSYDLGRLSIHRKLPRTESLKDCMERTIPYWTSTIEPEVSWGGTFVDLTPPHGLAPLFHSLPLSRLPALTIGCRAALHDVRQAIDVGKSVLVSTSENAIRGLLMHLCAIPKERISEIEIPTGLPLVYDLRERRLRLLEGEPSDYNFGKGVDMLFTPRDTR